MRHLDFLFLAAVVSVVSCTESNDTIIPDDSQKEVVQEEVPKNDEAQNETFTLVYEEDGHTPFDAALCGEVLTSEEIALSERIEQIDNKIFYSMLEGNSENVVFSPYSLQQVLMMAFNGADEEKRSSLLEFYGLTPEETVTLNTLTKKTRTIIERKDSPVTFNVNNVLWMDYSCPVYRSYAELLENYYDSELYAVDCSAESAKETINKWISEKTNGCIKDVIKESPLMWRISLMNAIYLKGSWDQPFSETRKHTFKCSEDEETEVDMMFQTSGMCYAENDNGRLVSVLLEDYDYEIDFFLPSEKSDEVDVLSSIDALKTATKKELVEFALPKFQFANEYGLDNLMKKIGLNLFDTKYNLISPASNLNMGDLSQNVFIDMNENGIEAAALTHLTYTSTGEEMPYVKPVKFYLDRPFYFVVRNNNINESLFIGKINKL